MWLVYEQGIEAPQHQAGYLRSQLKKAFETKEHTELSLVVRGSSSSRVEKDQLNDGCGFVSVRDIPFRSAVEYGQTVRLIMKRRAQNTVRSS